MNTILKIASGLLIFQLMISCVSGNKLGESNVTITPLGDKVTITEGSLVYALPMTVLHFFVTVEHEIEKPGPYSKYAGEFLGLSDVINEENETWIIKGIDVKTSQEIDPSEFYIIESNTLFQSNVLSLKKEGLIMDLNPDTYNSISGKSTIEDDSFKGFQYNDMGAYEYFMVSRDTSYRVVEVDTAFIRIPYLVEKKRPLTIDVLAENAAKTLLELRDGKQMILTGEANVFPQDASAIIEMNRMEREYLELFTGKTWNETKTFVYEVIPSKSLPSTPQVIFKFSDVMGVIEPSGQGGTPVTIELVPALKTKDLVMINKSQASSSRDEAFDKLYYRVPDVVNVKVISESETLYNSRKLIYQLGEIVTLPANYIIGK